MSILTCECNTKEIVDKLPVNKRRGRIEIIIEILSLCREPQIKFRILCGCNLNYKRLQKYLKYVLSHDLMEVIQENPHFLFQSTEKGVRFLKIYSQLCDVMEEKGALL